MRASEACELEIPGPKIKATHKETLTWRRAGDLKVKNERSAFESWNEILTQNHTGIVKVREPTSFPGLGGRNVFPAIRLSRIPGRIYASLLHLGEDYVEVIEVNKECRIVGWWLGC